MKAALDTASKQIVLARTLIDRGCTIAAPALANPDAAIRQAAETAIQTFDNLAGDIRANPAAWELAALLTQIDTAITAMRTAIRNVVNPAGFFQQIATSPIYTLGQLDFEIDRLNLVAWSIFALLSVIVGLVVLVLGKPSFGTAQDYLLCLLWGFGLPGAGTGLSTLTTASVRSSLSVAVSH